MEGVGNGQSEHDIPAPPSLRNSCEVVNYNNRHLNFHPRQSIVYVLGQVY